MHGEIEVNRAIQNADILISLRMRFDHWAMVNITEFGENQKIIHIEVGSSEIGKNVSRDELINTGLKETLVGIKKLI